MKFFNLAITLVFLFSCSHQSKRNPANQSDHYLLSKYKEESVRYILSYLPKEHGTFNDLLMEENAEKLYKLLGRIDLGVERPIHSRFTGSEVVYQSVFNLTQVDQVSYEKWLRMESDVSEAYRRGDYVFKKGHDFFTLSGLKLNLSHIDHQIFLRAQRYIPNLDNEDFALSLFNRKILFPTANGGALVLPTVGHVEANAFNYIREDFQSQVNNEIQASPIELLNYNYKKGLELGGKYKIYRDQKYQNFISDEAMADSEVSCDTKFYFRSLTRNPEAQRFIDTLLEHKSKLMEELDLTNNEYDELLVLALGILAVESKMGKSIKYKIKEDIRIGRINFGQIGINLIKRLKGRDDDNSRGLTQIKNIGPLLENTSYAYLEHSNLDNPENAALATMFVLKEKLGYLRHFSARHPNITSNNWADYLYYFYQGASSQITKGLATPPLNLRIQKILEVKEDSMVFSNCD